MFVRIRTVFYFIASTQLGVFFAQLRSEFPEYSDAEIREALAALCGGGMIVKVRDVSGITYRKATSDEMMSRIFDNARIVGGFSDDN